MIFSIINIFVKLLKEIQTKIKKEFFYLSKKQNKFLIYFKTFFNIFSF
jgi:hypothetical protein